MNIRLYIMTALAFAVLFPCTTLAADIGKCRSTKEKYAKHIFFQIESGKKLLVDAKKYGATKQLLAKEKSLLALENKDHQLTRNRLLGCKEASAQLSLLSEKADKVVASIKKKYDSLHRSHLRALAAIQKWKETAYKYRRQRWTWAMRIGGGVMVFAGVAMIGIEGYDSVKKGSDANGMMLTAGVGSAVVGTAMIITSFTID